MPDLGILSLAHGALEGEMGKGTNLLTAGLLYGAWKAGGAVGNKISEAKLRAELEETFRNDFVKSIYNDILLSTNRPETLRRAINRRVYQELFRLYGESVADFFLGKAEKSNVMGVQFDYDDELSKFAKIYGLSLPDNAFSKIVTNSILVNKNVEVKAESLDSVISKIADALNNGITYSRLPHEPILARRGYVFDGIKYEAEAEAVAARDKWIAGLVGGPVREEIVALREWAISELSRIDAIELIYGKGENDGILVPAIYKFDGKRFRNKKLVDEYIGELKKKPEAIMQVCNKVLGDH